MQLVNLHIAATYVPVWYFSVVIVKAWSIKTTLYRACIAHYLKGEPQECNGSMNT
jgi:hypothetical protein